MIFLLVALPLNLFYLSQLLPTHNYVHGAERYMHVMHYAMNLTGQKGRMPASIIELSMKTMPGYLYGLQYHGRIDQWERQWQSQGYTQHDTSYLPGSPWRRFEALSRIELEPEITVAFQPERTALAYSPLGYLPFIAAGVVGLLLHLAPVVILYFMVTVNMLVCLWLGYITIRVAPNMRWIFMFLLLLPSMCMNRCYVMPDGLTNGLSFLMVALILRERAEPRLLHRLQWLKYIALSSAIGLAKVAYFMLPAVAWLVPSRSFGRPQFRNLFVAACIASAFFSAMAWNIYTAEEHFNIAASNPQNFAVQTIHIQWDMILHQPLEYLATMAFVPFEMHALADFAINLVFWNRQGPLHWGELLSFQEARPWAAIILLGALLAQALFPLREGPSLDLTKRERCLCLGIFLTGYAIILTLNFLFHGDATHFPPSILKVRVAAFHSLIQGRYFLPILPLLLLAAYRPGILRLRWQGASLPALAIAAISMAACHMIMLGIM